MNPRGDSLPSFPKRRAESHKGDFGRGLIVAGSRGMVGAAALAGKAALRAGAGTVCVATPESVQDVVASFEPAYTTLGLPCDAAGQLVLTAAGPALEAAEPSTAAAVGPGLGRSASISRLVGRLYRRLSVPMVVDADGLNGLAELCAEGADWPPAAASRVLTPHPGEFRRLCAGAGSDRETQVAAAARFAAERGVILVLKGHRTYLTDGRRDAFNETGNPGLATGGAGDVLTGLITGLLCQGMDPWDAARLGTHLHGLAGDLGAKALGAASLTATDLLSFIPSAIQRFTAE